MPVLSLDHAALQLSRHLQVLRRASEGVFVPLTVGGGIRGFTDAEGRRYSALDVAAEYFRSGADKVSIGSDAVDAALEYMRTGEKTGKTAIEQISWVSGTDERQEGRVQPAGHAAIFGCNRATWHRCTDMAQTHPLTSPCAHAGLWRSGSGGFNRPQEGVCGRSRLHAATHHQDRASRSQWRAVLLVSAAPMHRPHLCGRDTSAMVAHRALCTQQTWQGAVPQCSHRVGHVHMCALPLIWACCITCGCCSWNSGLWVGCKSPETGAMQAASATKLLGTAHNCESIAWTAAGGSAQ